MEVGEEVGIMVGKFVGGAESRNVGRKDGFSNGRIE